MKRFHRSLCALFAATFLSACVSVSLGPDYEAPLHKVGLLDGSFRNQVAVIDISGMITTSGKRSMFDNDPSTVEHVMMQLRAAAHDRLVKAVVIKINSPGGTVTASDIIYREIMNFRRATDKKVVVMMMDVAASGGYYIALPADRIYAHPSTITGSVGVIMASPNFTGLMDKIGVEFMVYKSGENKDAGSPFREPTESDIAVMKNLNAQMAAQFHFLLQQHRSLSPANVELVKTARIFTGAEAQHIGLVDEVGYLSDALTAACAFAGGSEEDRCRVVAYRYQANANDTVYHSSAEAHAPAALLKLPGVLEPLDIKPGHYYLWPGGL